MSFPSGLLLHHPSPTRTAELLDLLTAGGPPVVILATITMSLVALVILLQNVVIIYKHLYLDVTCCYF